MIKCAMCIWLDYYPPTHNYVKVADGRHRCYLCGGICVNTHKDTSEELESKNLQHVCAFRKTKLPVQLEIPF